jgi:hypothetical protein
VCKDKHAIENVDAGLCGTIYCLARFNGTGVCDQNAWMSPEWNGYRKRACEALALGTHFHCDKIPMSEKCIQWYALMQDNITLCKMAGHNPGDDCAGDFAFWRGDSSYCMAHNTLGGKTLCESRYYMMAAIDERDEALCGKIKTKKELVDCRRFVHMSPAEKEYPLFEVENQLLIQD